MSLIDNLNLKDKKQKSDLIQTLLIVSSVLVALKTQDILYAPFMFFIFMSIFYYILIQKDKLEPSILLDLIVAIIAGSFSTLVNVNLFSNFWNALNNSSPSIGIILYFIYYALLSFMLWAALVKR